MTFKPKRWIWVQHDTETGEYRWNEVQSTRGKASINDVLSASSGTCFLLYNKPVHAYWRWSMSRNKDAKSRLARLAIFCCSVLKQAVIVTHICWAIDVVQEIPYGKRQPATSGRTHWETALRLKISPSHLMLAPRTGKCVWRPLALFLYLPVTHTAAAQAEAARHAVWLWQAAFNTL